MSRPDYYTHTEADAGRYEAAHNEMSALEWAIECGYDPNEDYR